jgi:hypothetical protein
VVGFIQVKTEPDTGGRKKIVEAKLIPPARYTANAAEADNS